MCGMTILPNLRKLMVDCHQGSTLHATDVSIIELGSGLAIRIIQEILCCVKRIIGYDTQGSGI